MLNLSGRDINPRGFRNPLGFLFAMLKNQTCTECNCSRLERVKFSLIYQLSFKTNFGAENGKTQKVC